MITDAVAITLTLEESCCVRNHAVLHYTLEGSESEEMGFCLSSGMPEFKIEIARSSISGRTIFF